MTIYREFEDIIKDCDKIRIVNFLKTLFRGDSKGNGNFGGTDQQAADGITILGSVTLFTQDRRPKPILCCAKQMDGVLTERSSRRKQFDIAVKVLKENFIHPYMGNGPVQGSFTQGLFFFFDEPGNFRLSLVTCDIVSGKMELNNYRRQSFFIEAGKRNNTFRTRLCEKSPFSSFDDFKAAFDVEKLSDDFFREYKVFYEDIVQYITGKRIVKKDSSKKYTNEPMCEPCREIFDQFIKVYGTGDNAEKAVRNYVKKMMGRLVFIQFLQKKGWLGIPANQSDWRGGDTDFLQNIFTEVSPEDRENFVDNILEVIFFEAFNTKENERHINNATLKKYRYPFLNCGLFDRDEDDRFKCTLPPAVFSNAKFSFTPRQAPDFKNWSKKRKPYFNSEACGLFDFFDRFNFTIDENDPTDAEVSVDPEMLSKIFENLLEDNKDKGAFYTPKEIVNYMVNESLIAYLETETSKVIEPAEMAKIRNFVLTQDATPFNDSEKATLEEKLAEVKICDPAIGSGAFPMGLLNLLCKCRQSLQPAERQHDKKMIAALKRDIIQQNIYGVDIEKGAVDIARLRFWLSLIVDEDTPEVLPNLEFKIMQGNSLLESYEGIDLSGLAGERGTRERGTSKVQISMVFDEKQAMEQIQKDLNKFYKTDSHAEKESLTLSINNNVREYIKYIAPQKSKEIDAMPVPNDKFFLWHTYFRDVFSRKGKEGFDIVIGNPPYIPLQDNDGLLADIYEKQDYQVFERGGDIYSLFYEQGVRLLRGKGNLCYITSCQWIRAGYGEKLRGYLATKTNPKILIDFTGVKVFDDATVDPSILLVNNSKNKGSTLATMTKPHGKEILPHLDQFIKQNAIPCSFMGPESWVILENSEQSLKDKIKETGIPLNRLNAHIYRGVLTGCNDAFIISDEKRNDIISKCSSADERKRTEKLIQPVLRGRDIRKFGFIDNRLFQINTHNGIKKKKISRINIEDFPAVKSHLDSLYKEISKRADKGETPYNLRNCAYLEAFYRPKIVYPETTVRRSEFFYDESGILLDKTCFFISGENLKFIQGILVSKVMEWYLERECRLLGKTTIQYSKQWMENIPIPPATHDQQQSIINLVDSILSAKKKDSSADTSKLEEEIDNLVYDLYGLTPEEIAIVKGGSPAQNDDGEKARSDKPHETHGSVADDDFLQGEDL